jgi:hypothetical protein
MHTKEATKYVGKRIYLFSDGFYYDNTLVFRPHACGDLYNVFNECLNSHR